VLAVQVRSYRSRSCAHFKGRGVLPHRRYVVWGVCSVYQGERVCANRHHSRTITLHSRHLTLLPTAHRRHRHQHLHRHPATTSAQAAPARVGRVPGSRSIRAQARRPPCGTTSDAMPTRAPRLLSCSARRNEHAQAACRVHTLHCVFTRHRPHSSASSSSSSSVAISSKSSTAPRDGGGARRVGVGSVRARVGGDRVERAVDCSGRVAGTPWRE
jgi:hypothetical protein